MIFLHIIIGAFLGKLFGHYAAFILGSAIMDLDHLYVYFTRGGLGQNFSWKRLVGLVKKEEKYRIQSRTAVFHSLLGMVVFSGIVYLIAGSEAIFFGIAYLLHLLLDLLDKDVQYLLFPWKIPFRGFLPIWSRPEQIATVVSLIGLGVLFLFY